MTQKPGFAQALFVALVLASPAWSAPTIVTVSGRQILVSGTPFTVKGVNYSATPVGSTVGSPGGICTGPYQWWTDQSTYNADFPLIKRMGANTVRAYGILNDTSPTAVLQVRAMLDAAQAQGLYVIMNYYPDHFVDPTNPAQQAAWQAGFVAGINAYEDHAAVLIWEFANENNLDNGQSAAWYPLVQTIATAAKAADANHPIMTVEGETNVIDYTIGSVARSADDANLTSIDIWGVNAYRGPGFQGLFEDLELVTAKPLLLTEFGKDAYLDSASQENQSLQASHIQSQWGEISSRLSEDNATEPLIGAVVFEWTDEWWKDAGVNSCVVHDTGILFTRPLDTADPSYNDEWFGISAVSPINAISNPAGTARTLRTSYSTLQSFWNPGAAQAAAGSTQFFSDTVRNYPNPFRLGSQATKFVIQANVIGTVNLRVYDAAGQFVTSFQIGVTPPARSEVLWDGKNGQGEQVHSGLYLVRIEGEGSGRQETQFRKVVGVK